MSTCESLTLQIANLPVPLSQDFTADELALIVGSCLQEPFFVIDCQQGLLAAANPRFLELFGILPEEVHSGGFSFERLVFPEDRQAFAAKELQVPSTEMGSFEIRFVTRAGKEFASEVTLFPFRWNRRGFLLGFPRPIGDRKDRENEWKQEVEEQKKRTLEAIKSSIRIYQITEKIKRTLALTKSLLNTENEAQLFESAARILTNEGLNYRDVTFLMVVGSQLEVRHSTKPFLRGRFSLNEENRYALFVRQGFTEEDPSKDEILVPLRSRGNFLGLIEVGLISRERIFFDDLRVVSEWQRNVLFTIGDIIALHLDNLQLYSEIRRQSVIDPLTGTFNRHYFVGRLSTEINRCGKAGHPISLIFIDVDELKPINDLHGHLQGDQVLRELGAIFLNNLRDADCVCRYGGDEFVVLLPEVDGERAYRIAQKLLNAVREHKFYLIDAPGKTIDVTVSMGVSFLEKDQDEDLFLQAADAALYRAKKLGRNRCEPAAISGGSFEAIS